MLKKTLSTLASLLALLAIVGLAAQAANEGHHLSFHATQALTDHGSHSQIQNLDPPCWSCTHAPRQEWIFKPDLGFVFTLPHRVQQVVTQTDRTPGSPHFYFSARGPPRQIA